LENAEMKVLSNPFNVFRKIGLDLTWVMISVFASIFIVEPSGGSFATSTSIFQIELQMMAIAAGVLLWRRVHRMNPRYVSVHDQINLSICAAAISIGCWITATLEGASNPLALAIVTGSLCLAGMAGTRVAFRLYSWGQTPFGSRPQAGKLTRTLIVGAGDAGEFVLREMMRSDKSTALVMGFVDDDPQKQSLIIRGVRVLGTTNQIPMLCENLDIEEILLCTPSADGDAIRRINELCKTAGAKVKTLPSVSQLLTSSPSLKGQMRDIAVEDLLRRPAAPVDSALLTEITTGESVLVTGGGGSIGSELARQVNRLSPAKLILVGKGENSLYEIEQELIQTQSGPASAVVADVRDHRSMNEIFTKHCPTVVFHAAAHKHVPLMQSNPIEAIRNNVFGTLNTVQTSIKHGVQHFVLISTDKAVNPTSVMGATKRIAEMIVAAHARQSDTYFGIVRFGNVLGSRGSLIPLLKNQIARGGPVRITHPEMTRYFMTIPEAVQLILQAGARGRNGELFILDMGEPVKILDLAEDLIRLHGLEPYKDIEVKFIGPRPGEKLFEELTYDKEALTPTDNPKINMAKTGMIDMDWLMSELNQLDKICESGDEERAMQFLMELAWGKHDISLQTWEELKRVA
jgi:FlaA1/EpsC-like NDP-sugar epimerase